MLRQEPVRYPQWFAALSCAAVLSIGAEARAFDGQVALGGGLGLARYDEAKSVGPLASVYGVYGVSDCFDARLELSSAFLRPEASADRAFLSSAVGYFTYKLDVIQWIPWGGFGVGAYQLGHELSGPKRDAFELGGGPILGFDYAWTRHDGLSLAVAFHVLPFTEDDTFDKFSITTAALRYEHRWGW
jgi:hypothetical protein